MAHVLINVAAGDLTSPRAFAFGWLRTRWLPTAAVAGEVGLAGALGLLRLGAKSLWYDESYTAQLTQLKPALFAYQISHTDMKMVLYYLLMRPWSAMAGISEAALRAPSAIAFALTVPLLFFLGRRLLNTAVGLIAGLLYALSPFAVQYAQEARAYALVALLAVASTYALVRAMESRNRALLWWMAWAFLAAALVYTHILALAVVAAQLFGILLHPSRRRFSRNFVYGLLAWALLVAPLALLVVRGGDAAANESWVPRLSPHDLYVTATDFAGGSLAMLVIVATLTCIGSIVALRRTLLGKRAWLLIAWGVGVPLAVVIASVVRPVLVARYVLDALPGVILLMAIAISAIKLRTLRTLVLAAVVGVTAWSTALWYTDHPKEDWRSATSYVLSSAQSGDGILFDAGTYTRPPFVYYARQGKRAILRGLTPVYPLSWSWNATDYPGLTAQDIDIAAAAHPRMWIVISHSAESISPDNAAASWLFLHYRIESTHTWVGVEVVLLSRS